ncbi:phage head completion protein [Falsigemmobacter faecalis]|uniref:Head-tail adaptor protein n=1 Tax=Falsigemmobacter faecalis TaxID=2488730 RepID=A0A3P3D6F7_9RHOB|nr:head-tail adaptor protein [Falsigemmobacter faecalis]RRH69970.1 head-tail adaptor protein [Falsigemmobacter faecalis]
MARALDRRIELIRVGHQNTGNGIRETITPIGSVWASRSDVGDAERAVAGTVQGTVRTAWLVRSSPLTRELKPKDRLTSQGLTFEILGLREIGRGNLIELTTEARLDR